MKRPPDVKRFWDPAGGKIVQQGVPKMLTPDCHALRAPPIDFRIGKYNLTGRIGP